VVELPSADAIEGAIRAALPPAAPVVHERHRGGREAVLRTTPDGLLPMLATLRDAPSLDFAQLMDICAVDWPDRPERFEVTYNLLSLTNNWRVTVIAPVAEGAALPTASLLYPNATWYEREVWDMHGVVFAGQPDLRRLLTDYGFHGHPLRKDFPLTGFVEVRYDEVERRVVQEPVKLTQDFRDFDFLSPWEAMTTLPGDEKVHRNRLAAEGANKPLADPALEAPKGTP
jgi:NADH-quinone oxidoreductase subunit C